MKDSSLQDLTAEHWRLSPAEEGDIRLVHRSYHRMAALAPFGILPVIGVIWFVDGARDFTILFTGVGIAALTVIVAFYLHLESLSRRLGPYLEVRDGEIRLRGDRRFSLDELDGFEIVDEKSQYDAFSTLQLRTRSGESLTIVSTNHKPSLVKLKQELEDRIQPLIAT